VLNDFVKLLREGFCDHGVDPYTAVLIRDPSTGGSTNNMSCIPYS
jgi:hypothetical protein